MQGGLALQGMISTKVMPALPMPPFSFFLTFLQGGQQTRIHPFADISCSTRVGTGTLQLETQAYESPVCAGALS